MFENTPKGAAFRTACNAQSPSEGLGEVIHKTPCLVKAVYDFAVQGGAIGNLLLLDDAGNKAILPTGAVVTRVRAYVVTAVTSAGSATVAGTLLAGGDMMAATAKASLTIGAFIDGVPAGTAATLKGPVVSATGTQLSVDVAVAALTAGKIQFFVDYIII